MISIEIPDKLQKDIMDFVHFNEIEDHEKFILSLIQKGLNIVKYGSRPFQKEKESLQEEAIEHQESDNNILATQIKKKVQIIKK